MRRGVFISYRRADTANAAGRLFDLLETRFGDQAFMDVVTIRPGVNFVEEIRAALASCSVVVVLIGSRWLAPPESRKHGSEDFVRLEIAAAIEMGVTLLPVLVDDARVPAESELPDDLRPLALIEPMPLRHASFDRDAAGLCDLLLARAGVPPFSKVDAFLERFKLAGVQKLDERMLRIFALGAIGMNFVTVMGMGMAGQFLPIAANRPLILGSDSLLPALVGGLTVAYGYLGRRSVKYGLWAVRGMWIGAGLIVLQAALVGYALFLEPL